jgi:hypothetical protein
MDWTGRAFLTVFGLAWWLLGASAVGESLWPVAAAAGCAVAMGVWRTGPDSQRSGRAPLPADVRRRFAWINALQWLAIAVVAGGALAVGVAELIPGLVAVVVGLHFLPLAALFRLPRFHLTGALMITAGTAGCSISVLGGPAGTVQMTVGVSAAVILWGTGCVGATKPTEPTSPAGRPGAEEPTGTS